MLRLSCSPLSSTIARSRPPRNVQRHLRSDTRTLPTLRRSFSAGFSWRNDCWRRTCRSFATAQSKTPPTPKSASGSKSSKSESEAREALIQKITAKITQIAKDMEKITPESQRPQKHAQLLNEVRAIGSATAASPAQPPAAADADAQRAALIREAQNDVGWLDKNTKQLLQKAHKLDPTLLRDVLQRVGVEYEQRFRQAAGLPAASAARAKDGEKTTRDLPVLTAAMRRKTEEQLQAHVEFDKMKTLQRDRVAPPPPDIKKDLGLDEEDDRMKARPEPPPFEFSPAAPVPAPARGARAPSQLSASELGARADELLEQASNAIDQEQWLDAQKALETAATLRLQQLGETHAQTIESHMALAFVYQNLGKREMAAELYEKWLSRKRAALKDQLDSALGIALLNFAELHGAFGRISEAEKLAAEAVAVLTKTLGEGEQLAGAMLNHAGFLAALGKVGEGLKHARAGLDMLEKHLGSKNEYVMAAVQNVLKMLHDLNRKDEIEPLVEQWRHKLNNPNFRLLTEEDLEKLVPADINLQSFAAEAAPQTVGKALDPAGVIKPAGVYKREWETLWALLEKKGLTSDPVMQRLVLEDLERVGHVSADEAKKILRHDEKSAADIIHNKISSLSDADFEELHRAYRATQRDNPDGEPGRVLASMQL